MFLPSFTEFFFEDVEVTKQRTVAYRPRQVKKVREKKKDGDIEDWQSNLEGWKSSRRKKQEDVIERVTEVKRMEQEEAIKASEAAAKRLIGIRCVAAPRPLRGPLWTPCGPLRGPLAPLLNHTQALIIFLRVH